MRIRNIVLMTDQLDSLKHFYATKLGMPMVLETKGCFSVKAGSNTLCFTEAQADRPYYHFAFNISENKLIMAKEWLRMKAVPLNRLNEGGYELYSTSWNSTSVYFYDPAGNIVEFIARHSLRNAANGAFTCEDIRSISEIGLAVGDVPQMAEWLQTSLGIEVYKVRDEQFAPMGDEEGLFIVSSDRRMWLGSDKKARGFPLEVTFEAQEVASGRFRQYPYLFNAVSR